MDRMPLKRKWLLKAFACWIATIRINGHTHYADHPSSFHNLYNLSGYGQVSYPKRFWPHHAERAGFTRWSNRFWVQTLWSELRKLLFSMDPSRSIWYSHGMTIANPITLHMPSNKVHLLTYLDSACPKVN